MTILQKCISFLATFAVLISYSCKHPNSEESQVSDSFRLDSTPTTWKTEGAHLLQANSIPGHRVENKRLVFKGAGDFLKIPLPKISNSLYIDITLRVKFASKLMKNCQGKPCVPGGLAFGIANDELKHHFIHHYEAFDSNRLSIEKRYEGSFQQGETVFSGQNPVSFDKNFIFVRNTLSDMETAIESIEYIVGRKKYPSEREIERKRRANFNAALKHQNEGRNLLKSTDENSIETLKVTVEHYEKALKAIQGYSKPIYRKNIDSILAEYLQLFSKLAFYKQFEPNFAIEKYAKVCVDSLNQLDFLFEESYLDLKDDLRPPGDLTAQFLRALCLNQFFSINQIDARDFDEIASYRSRFWDLVRTFFDNNMKVIAKQLGSSRWSPRSKLMGAGYLLLIFDRLYTPNDSMMHSFFHIDLKEAIEQLSILSSYFGLQGGLIAEDQVYQDLLTLLWFKKQSDLSLRSIKDYPDTAEGQVKWTDEIGLDNLEVFEMTLQETYEQVKDRSEAETKLQSRHYSNGVVPAYQQLMECNPWQSRGKVAELAKSIRDVAQCWEASAKYLSPTMLSRD